jgi:hypothetical protein
MVRESARKTSCGNNQRQIILSAMVYANDNDQLWPCRPTAAGGGVATLTAGAVASTDAFSTAVGSLEYLMIRNSADLPMKLFVCPSNTGTLGNLKNPTQIATATQETYSGNNSEWATDGYGASAYAYDWSAPTNTSAIRIIIVDRGNGPVSHKKVIMGAAGDGHVVTINQDGNGAKPATSNFTINNIDGTTEPASYPAKDSSDTQASPNGSDDVYDSAGDDLNQLKPAGGSATRSWCK